MPKVSKGRTKGKVNRARVRIFAIRLHLQKSFRRKRDRQEEKKMALEAAKAGTFGGKTSSKKMYQLVLVNQPDGRGSEMRWLDSLYAVVGSYDKARAIIAGVWDNVEQIIATNEDAQKLRDIRERFSFSLQESVIIR